MNVVKEWQDTCRALDYSNDDNFVIAFATLEKIASLEESFKDAHPEFKLLQACALAKEALKKMKG